MSRQARQIGESGYMHVIVRGNGKQVLFEDRRDYQFFLSILERYSRETGVGICAYCLMENHVHLLVHDAERQLPLLMKKLCVCYALYFNRRYKREGHLFQGRYLSENVNDDAYLLTVFRYILNNAQKAGICRASDYEWSSYGLYDSPPSFMELSLLKELIGDSRHFEAFMATPETAACLDYEGRKKNDDWARQVIAARLGEQSGTALQAYEKNKRNEVLVQLLNDGLSIRQIERLTGISKGVIQRVKR